MFIPMIVMGESEYYGLAVISGFVLALGGIIYAGDMKCPGCGLKIGFGNSKLFDDVYVRKTFAPKRCVQCVITSYSIHYTKLYDLSANILEGRNGKSTI